VRRARGDRARDVEDAEPFVEVAQHAVGARDEFGVAPAPDRAVGRRSQHETRQCVGGEPAAGPSVEAQAADVGGAVDDRRGIGQRQHRAVFARIGCGRVLADAQELAARGKP